jgi:hypothetical protein
MGKQIEDLNLSDAPNSPTRRRDLFMTARAYAEEMRKATSSEKTVMAVYRVPAYIRWAVEMLSEEATHGTLEPAATAVLDVGLSAIRRFPGVVAICKARLTVLPLDDAQTMEWFNHFPTVSVPAVDTDDSGEFRVHVPRALAKVFAKLARSLGMPISRLGIFALMAGVLHAPSLCALKYRQAMVETTQRLKAEMKRRGNEARTRAANAVPRDRETDHLWTAADFTDEADSDDADHQ